MTKYIALCGKYGSDKVMVVDDRDYERMSKFSWYVNAKGYAFTIILAHKDILKIYNRSGERIIDHVDGDHLNNQRKNLRFASATQNLQNRKLPKNNKTGYKGVVKRKGRNNPYYVFIGSGTGGKADYIGAYPTAEEAARAYDKEAKKRFGKFARFNFPEDK